MRTALIECVPNVSEGRDRGVIRALRDALEAAGAQLIDVHSDGDHHRSVFTYFGSTEVVERATLALDPHAEVGDGLTMESGASPVVPRADEPPFILTKQLVEGLRPDR